MQQQQFWNLLARKLAGEASARELYELDKLLYGQPELQFWARLVTELWQNREAIEKEPEGEEKFLQLLQEAFQRKFFGDQLRAGKKGCFPI